VNRKRLILGITTLILLAVLIVSGLFLSQWRENRRSRVDRRFPLQGLGYCTSDSVKPCVVSFSQDSDENMLVSFLTDGAFYPDFYLKIKTDQSDHIYVCQKVNRFATSVYCTGKLLPLGKVFQFLIFSINEDILLAQGSFPIIGIALATPEVFSSPTPFVIPTEGFTPVATPSPSYPSYPGP